MQAARRGFERAASQPLDDGAVLSTFMHASKQEPRLAQRSEYIEARR